MAYQEGDTSPPHTNVHNDVRTQLDELSTEFEIPVVLPPVVGLGHVGHVDHHNLFTTAIAELSKHECEDGLEGLGGWAEITEVSGSPKRYAYGDWVAFEWTQDGSLTTDAGGLVDALLVGGGTESGNSAYGGRVNAGMISAPQSTTVTVGVFGVAPNLSGTPCSRSALTNADTDALLAVAQAGENYAGTYTNKKSWGAGAEVVVAPLQGVKSSITGAEVEYGKGYNGTNANNGEPGSAGPGGGAGRVIVRVPADQAAGVDPGSWVTRIDYYAEVTDGTVTDLYQERFYGDDTVRTENGRYASPEQPDDLIPCDPTVAEGWTYADGEFTPPPPDPSWREQAIKALQEQIKELQKDTK